MTDVALTNRRKILAIEQAMREDASLPPLVCELVHSFSHDVYARTMILPEGGIVVGKIHRYSCHNFVMRGHVTVFDSDGITDYHAPCFFVSPAGTKRVLIANTETEWTTVHGTEKTDLAELEAELIVTSFDVLGININSEDSP